MTTEILSWMANIITSFISWGGNTSVFLLMTLESCGIPIPSEVTMPFAGFLASQGTLNLWTVAIVGALANLAGSLLAYWIGWKGGRPLVEKYGKYILLSHHDLEKSDRFFQKYGKATVFFTRLLPIIRTYISFPAGIAKMNLTEFSIYTLLGSFPWSLGLAYLGFRLGENWEELRGFFHKFDYLILGLIILGIIYFIRKHLKK